MFQADAHGRTFADVIERAPDALREVIDVIARPDAQLRMFDAEAHQERPAFSGAAVDIERCPAVQKILEGRDKLFRDRFKRAAGTAVRIVMEGLGAVKTGHKSAVGVGQHFRTAERYGLP